MMPSTNAKPSQVKPMTPECRAAINACANEITRSMSTMYAGSMRYMQGTGNTKRTKLWDECGIPQAVTAADYYSMYTRNSIAAACVDRYASKTWQQTPKIIDGIPDDDAEDETAWAQQIRTMFRRKKFWKALKKADTWRLAQGWSLILVKARDSKKLSEPLDAIKESAIVGVEVILRSAVNSITWKEDEPEIFQVATEPQSNDINTAGKERQFKDIHASRIIVVGDISDGHSLLEAGYNDLLAIEKVVQSHAEGYVKNVSRQLHLGFDKETKIRELADVFGVEESEVAAEFQTMFKRLNQSVDAGAVTIGGASMDVLTVSTPDPQEPYDVLVNSVAASVMMPVKILIGNQTGERASTEDQKDWAQTITERQTEEAGEIIDDAISWLMAHGVILLPQSGEWSVVWPDLLAPSPMEKAELAVKLNELNAGGGEWIIQPNELRVAAGYEPEDEMEDIPADAEMDGEEDGASGVLDGVEK